MISEACQDILRFMNENAGFLENIIMRSGSDGLEHGMGISSDGETLSFEGECVGGTCEIVIPRKNVDQIGTFHTHPGVYDPDESPFSIGDIMRALWQGQQVVCVGRMVAKGQELPAPSVDCICLLPDIFMNWLMDNFSEKD